MSTPSDVASAAAAASAADVPQQIDFNFGMAVERTDAWIDGATRLLPNIAVGLIVMLIFWGLGRMAQRVVNRAGARTERENLGEVLGGFVK